MPKWMQYASVVTRLDGELMKLFSSASPCYNIFLMVLFVVNWEGRDLLMTHTWIWAFDWFGESDDCNIKLRDWLFFNLLIAAPFPYGTTLDQFIFLRHQVSVPGAWRLKTDLLNIPRWNKVQRQLQSLLSDFKVRRTENPQDVHYKVLERKKKTSQAGKTTYFSTLEHFYCTSSIQYVCCGLFHKLVEAITW